MFEYLRDKTVLVTGGAGFIGSHLTERLLSLGAKVLIVDSFITGRRENLSKVLGSDNLTVIEADVTRSPEEYLPKNTILDLVLHFASPASPPWYQKYPVETYMVNAFGTHLLLEYLKKHSPSARMIFASTSEVYGDPKVHPQPEEYWGNVNPNGVRSCYDESKRMGETVCGVFHREFGMDVRIVRIFNTYGPHMNPKDGRVIPNFIMQALKGKPLAIYGDGSFTRSYCFVSDLVEYIMRMATFDGLAGETINIGNTTDYTVLETARSISQLILPGSEPVIEFLPAAIDDPTQRKPNIHKAQELLKFEPKTSLKEGLEQTIPYFRQYI